MNSYWLNIYFSLFTEAEVEEIHNITLREIVLNVTSIPSDSLNENPFFYNNGREYLNFGLFVIVPNFAKNTPTDVKVVTRFADYCL